MHVLFTIDYPDKFMLQYRVRFKIDRIHALISFLVKFCKILDVPVCIYCCTLILLVWYVLLFIYKMKECLEFILLLHIKFMHFNIHMFKCVYCVELAVHILHWYNVSITFCYIFILSWSRYKTLRTFMYMYLIFILD